MAGDIQQPFSLSFQVDALHSSSISFGRFELESLSWERRSSFSHNRYLEEVEKYARPGSVTEKKEYFEAHFRKRALLRQASSATTASQAEQEGSNSDSGSYGTSTCEDIRRDWIHGEAPKQTVEKDNVCRFDESPNSSSHESGFLEEIHTESHTDSVASINDIDSVNDVDTSLKWSSLAADFGGGEQDDKARATDHSEIKMEPTLDRLDTIGTLEIDNIEDTCESGSSHDQVVKCDVQYNTISELRCTDEASDVLKEQSSFEGRERRIINKPSKILDTANKTRSSGLGSKPHGDVSRDVEARKSMAPTNGLRENRTPLRSRALKQLPEPTMPRLKPSLRLSKENPPNLKTNLPNGNSSEKELKPKRAVTPQPLTPERTESRRHPSAISTLKLMTSTRKKNGQSVMNSSFRSAGAAEKRREKMVAADIRQPSRKPDVKDKQKICSISNTVPRLSSREKSQVVPTVVRSGKASSSTLRSDSCTTTRSKPLSTSRDKHAISLNKAAGSRISLERISNVHSVINADRSSSITSHALKANQPKDIVRKKEGAVDRKPKAKEHGQITKGKFIEATPKGGLGKSGSPCLRKSMGHSSAVNTEPTPKVGPGRRGKAFLRKSMGH